LTSKPSIKLTANFERNLEDIEAFLIEADASQTFDALLDVLSDTVIPNLENFPEMARLLFDRVTRSVEVSNGIDELKRKLNAIGRDGELREYILVDYLLLYARFGEVVYLLSIRHHRQLSFDFQGLWGA